MRWLLLLTVAVMVSVTIPALAGTSEVACSPVTLGWVSLIQSGGAIPSFMFGAKLVVDHVTVCDDGVFLYFSTRTQGSYADFCLGFLKPTRESVAEFMGTDPTDPAGGSVSILEATAIASESYERFRGELVTVLGRRYAFGRPIPLNKDRWKATLEIEFGTPFVFSWRTREASILTGVFDVFTAPRGDGIHPVLLLMMLMPR